MTPLILLPGMMCDARLFAPQIDVLSETRPVLNMSMLSHDTMEALAADVLQKAPPEFAIAGLSMGGILAMEVLRQAPSRVMGLALMDTNPLAEQSHIAARRIPQMAAALDGRLECVMRNEMKPNYLTDGPHRARILDLCMAMALDLGPDVFVNQSRALRDRRDQTDTLKAFKKPALVLCGREDALCPVSRHELMHGLMPHSTLTIIENAGHLPTLEQPYATTTALMRWLEDT